MIVEEGFTLVINTISFALNQYGRQIKTTQTLLQMSEPNLGSSKLIGQSQIALTVLSDVKCIKQGTAPPRVDTVHSPLFFP